VKLISAIAVVVLLIPQPARSQGSTTSTTQQRAVVEKAIEYVSANYVFPEKASAVAAALMKNVAAGKYASLTKLDDFLDAVNSDMQAAGADKHLRISNNARIVQQLKAEAAGTSQASPEYVAMLRGQNFRLKRVETLDGNVGYFKFDNFVELEFCRESLAGAMNFLHYTAALILDLTDNGGGSSDAADYLISYFLKDGTTIGTSWNRQTNNTTTSSVVRASEVRQMLETPLFIMVSERTASAAEGVAYALQSARRAVVIGAQTRGLANPGVRFPIDDRLFIMVPTISSKNAITGTNWDGTGITPDIRVPAAKALHKAWAEALKALAASAKDMQERSRLLFAATGFDYLVAPQSPPAGFLGQCVGEYEEGQQIVMREGALYFVKGDIDRKLTYMNDHTFIVEGRNDYRMKFPLAGTLVDHCEVLWFDDTADRYKKIR
jgi:hypothetical protein